MPPHNIYFEVMMPDGDLEGWDMNIEPESLAMSTGRYDKSGEPIFGGDILYITHGSEAGDVQSAYSFLWDTKLCEWSLFRIDGESFIYVGNIAFKQERVINSGVTLYERSLK